MTDDHEQAGDGVNDDQVQERSPSRRLIDARQVARMLGCSWRTVLRLADGGKIPWGIKLGGLRRWDVKQIEDFIAGGCKMIEQGSRLGARRRRREGMLVYLVILDGMSNREREVRSACGWSVLPRHGDRRPPCSAWADLEHASSNRNNSRQIPPSGRSYCREGPGQEREVVGGTYQRAE